MRDYDDYLLWEVIYESHWPRPTGAEVLEIGSAPGDYLVRLSRRFGVVPYGIEYTDSGAELNRRTFSLNGLNPGNVIHGDFFSETFQTRYQEFFDVVVSRGFIEHFDEIRGVIEKHVSLLKPGGTLVISVPNFRGIYYLWMRVFRKKILGLHNLNVMRKKEFAAACQSQGITTSFCDYYGTFSFNHFHATPRSPLCLVTGFLHKFQKLLNVAFRLFWGDRGKESSIASPFLLFIGVKPLQATAISRPKVSLPA